MRKYLILLFIAHCSMFTAVGQFKSPGIYKTDSIGYLEVNGYIEKNRKPLENASITIYDGSKKVASIRSQADGKFNLKLEYNKYFKIEITKKGLVSKKFDFNTYFPAGEDNRAIIPFYFSLTLFPKYSNIDMDILEKPLAIIKYQNKYNDFFYDYDYSKSINDKVIDIQNKIEELIKEYGNRLDKGRKLFEMELYRESLMEFERAHEIYEDEPYPIERIATINTILNKEQNKQETYTRLLASAEEKVRNKTYDKAIDLLGQALQVLPTEKYPMQRITEIKRLMEKLAIKEASYKTLIFNADNSFSYKMYIEAEITYTEAGILFPDRKYPKEKIIEINIILSEINTETLYNISIAEGDKLLKNIDYTDAILAYTKAASIKSNESYPKERIDFINKKLTDLSIIEKDYISCIARADNHMENQDYELAKVEYNKASRIKPGEVYPKQKIKDIDNISDNLKANEISYENLLADADMKRDNMDYDGSVVQYNNALTYKPGEKYPEIQINKIKYLKIEKTKLNIKYLELITSADNLSNEKEYLKAKITYSDALDIKPEESYPQGKIKDIDQIITRQLADISSYNKTIDAADESMDLHDYSQAKKLFEKASEFIPGDQYSIGKIQELNKILVQNTNNGNAYSKMIEAADLLASTLKDYETAKALYLKASLIVEAGTSPAPTDLNSKIQQIDDIFKGFESEKLLYNSLILKADDLYDLQNYKEARGIYKKAEELIPIQTYPRQRISDINKILLALEYDKSISEIKNELIENQTEKKYSFYPIPDKRTSNFVTIDIKNLSEKSFKVLVFYGKNEERSGGFELDVPIQKDAITYNVSVGKQDKWVKAQVNWISIQPLGGDLEVNNIAIRKGE